MEKAAQAQAQAGWEGAARGRGALEEGAASDEGLSQTSKRAGDGGGSREWAKSRARRIPRLGVRRGKKGGRCT